MQQGIPRRSRGKESCTRRTGEACLRGVHLIEFTSVQLFQSILILVFCGATGNSSTESREGKLHKENRRSLSKGCAFDRVYICSVV